LTLQVAFGLPLEVQQDQIRSPKVEQASLPVQHQQPAERVFFKVGTLVFWCGIVVGG
jgi:hypothetical protein